jgi:LmbE family N-acetylglucosaminyl deacetylase
VFGSGAKAPQSHMRRGAHLTRLCIHFSIISIKAMRSAIERNIVIRLQANKPFDPASDGTPETEWSAFLNRFQDWQPKRGPLVVLAPHPDDEILGAGGLIHDWATQGLPVTIVSVTDGEAADLGRPGLDLIRREELQQALRKLCSVHVAVKRLGIPDGKVQEHANRLRNALDSHADSSGTLVVPYECDGHPDHEAVGKMGLELAAANGIAIARYPIWAWHRAQPSELATLPWKRFRLSLDAQRAKSRAIQCFESQLHPPRGSPIVPPNVLAYFARSFEAFIA